MTWWQRVVAASLVVVIVVLLIAHAAGVTPWTVGSVAVAGLATAIASVFGRRRTPPAPPAPARQAAELRETTRVETAEHTQAAGERALEERTRERDKQPLADRGQALIDEERAHRRGR